MLPHCNGGWLDLSTYISKNLPEISQEIPGKFEKLHDDFLDMWKFPWKMWRKGENFFLFFCENRKGY